VEVVARVMVVAMAANRAVMGGMENAVMNAEMTIHMDSNKAGATAANKEGMVEMANAATNAETMIHMDSSKAEAMVGAMAANKEGMVEMVNAVTSDATTILMGSSKAEVMAEVNKAVATAEGSKVVAMAEVNKADTIKVAVVATALKTVLAEDMEGEGISFKKVEDQVKALGVISIPTKL